jgi:hypothetical protein
MHICLLFALILSSNLTTATMLRSSASHYFFIRASTVSFSCFTLAVPRARIALDVKYLRLGIWHVMARRVDPTNQVGTILALIQLIVGNDDGSPRVCGGSTIHSATGSNPIRGCTESAGMLTGMVNAHPILGRGVAIRKGHGNVIHVFNRTSSIQRDGRITRHGSGRGGGHWVGCGSRLGGIGAWAPDVAPG